MVVKPQDLDLGKGYQYAWHDEPTSINVPERGLTEDVVSGISKLKGEPEWMLRKRLKAYRHFMDRPMPSWGGDLSEIDFDNIYYYIKPTEGQVQSWDELPDDIKNTYVKLGIPEAEREFLGGVTAQYESETVYHQVKKELDDLGVIFTSMDEGLREHEDIVKKYFGTVIPANDNKFAALNSAVWSGGSFIYVPPNTNVD
ncbi:MAG: Fe-S cluster assembly protein SufB, partial [Actinomycetota bacterium]